MKKKRIAYFLILSLFLQLCVCYKSATACIGKTITIGYKDFLEQRIIAEVIYIIITERTGTTVVLKNYPNTEECYKALEKNEINLCVEYVGAAYNEVLHKNDNQQIGNDAVIETVKNDYSNKRNMIWLNFLGFESKAPENEYLRKKGLPLIAGPVIGKETLKMFPILPRLLNKLSGKVNDSSLMVLIESVQRDKKDPRIVAQDFLKLKKLI